MSRGLLARICLLLSLLFPAAFTQYIFHHHAAILSLLLATERLILHLCLLYIVSGFVLFFPRQLLAPGYQEIWYAANGARKSSSPANTVSLRDSLMFFYPRQQAQRIVKNTNALHTVLGYMDTLCFLTKCFTLKYCSCLLAKLLLPRGGSGCGRFQRRS